ncbi:R2 [Symbiodinium pilosum]|uniref:R2 protein n=1 Tax=Symbiodinium pilosum TaxID=2952 RepID=A0A812YHS9_SYMPI|nr:R2 [Symbiodinium pilosum]
MSETVPLTGFLKADVQVTPQSKPTYDYSFMTGGLLSCFTYFCLPPCSSTCLTTFRNMSKLEANKPVEVADARKKQAEDGLNERDFFNKHGFVLLKHQTRMTAEDWLTSTAVPSAKKPLEKKPGEPSAVRDIYAQEIEPVIRELLPNANDIFFPASALRRGPGGPNTHYGVGVHQDYGLHPEDMKSGYKTGGTDSYEDFLEKLKREDTAGFSILNFWRPVLPMAGPVKSLPLALCDPSTVEAKDCLPIEVHGFVPGGQQSLILRFRKDQKWYYYPNMTTDEVLVFRAFHYERDVKVPNRHIRTVFHAAFNHPATSPQDEKRCSSEYRVGVWLK